MTLLLNRPKDKSANEPKYPEVRARAASVVRFQISNCGDLVRLDSSCEEWPNDLSGSRADTVQARDLS
jgi:hypothetical protein